MKSHHDLVTVKLIDTLSNRFACRIQVKQRRKESVPAPSLI